MADVSAALVKDLRTKTGAGMLDCKKALAETGGNVEAAVDWLRKKGLAAAAKKAGRVAAEGLVAVAVAGGKGAVVEVNAETDFVARNEQFQAMSRGIAQVALAQGGGDVAALAAAPFQPGGRTVQEEITNAIATIGENMTLRRAATLQVDGVVSAYVHSSLGEGIGKIGVIVALKSAGDKAKLEALGKQIAMHVAAANPQSLDVASLDPAAIERERAVLVEQAAASGKGADIAAKMAEGRMRKFYEEVVLLEQLFIMDGKTKVAKIVQDAAKDVGAPVELAGFVRYALGEGIDKPVGDDFASEVAKLAH